MFYFKVQRAELAKALDLLTPVIDKRSNMDILQCVVVEAKNGRLNLKASDLETTLQLSLPADVIDEGSFALSAKLFHDMIRSAKEDEVVIKRNTDGQANIACGALKASIFGLSTDSYPVNKDHSSSVFSTVDARELKEAISKTIFAIVVGEDNYNLRGAYMVREEAEDGSERWLRLASTDSLRLFTAKVPAESLDFTSTGYGILIPKKGYQALSDICSTADLVQLGLAGKNLVAKTEEKTLSIRLMEGIFPNYKGVIPKVGDYRFLLERKKLIDVMKSICIMSAADTETAADFSFRTDVLEISIASQKKGYLSNSMELEYQGRPLTVRFDPLIFTDFLGALKSEKILMEFSDGNTSFLITAPEDPGFLCVLTLVSPVETPP
jgi:DNA polymerase-3 subunit beta